MICEQMSLISKKRDHDTTSDDGICIKAADNFEHNVGA